MEKFNDIYEIIDYRGKRYFLVCMVEASKYFWIRDCGWGYIGEDWMSSHDPIEFIADHLKAVNSQTGSGVNFLKRKSFKKLIKPVKDMILEKTGQGSNQ